LLLRTPRRRLPRWAEDGHTQVAVGIGTVRGRHLREYVRLTWSFTVDVSEAPPWAVNADGRTDITDLVLVARGVGLSGSALWATPMQMTASILLIW
jgi:hypothetical protein